MSFIWRVILSDSGTGTWNMAMDEALLKSASSRQSLPTLRVYSWDPATLSLGFAQSVLEVDQKTLTKKGWGLVRRPTGGRAILHTDELTYSVTAPLDDPLLSGNLLESYRKISMALLAGLDYLGVNAAGDKEYDHQESQNNQNPVCFETPSNYEITAAGKKLIGSAQARKYGGLLQHGSLPLYGDLTRITQVLKYEDKISRIIASEKLTAHAVTLENVAGKVFTWQTVAEAIINGFSMVFDIRFEFSEPTSSEIQLASELEQSKYGSIDWTNRF
jgi:lipoate-protein ligase A